MRWVYSSMKQGIDPYEKRDKACDLGTYIHLCIEHLIYNAPVPEEDTSKMSFEDVLIAEKAVDKYKQLESDLLVLNPRWCLKSISFMDVRYINVIQGGLNATENEVVAAYLWAGMKTSIK